MPAAPSKRRIVPAPTSKERILLPCPALFKHDVTGATEEVDDFLARSRPYAAALGMNTLAEVAQDRDPMNARINMARVKAAEVMLRVSGALVEQVQVQTHHHGPMFGLPSEKLVEFIEAEKEIIKEKA